MLLRRAFLLAPVVPVFRGQDRQPKMFGDAEAYDQFMGRWSRLVAPRLVDFTNLPERGRMLDVGSGTGSLAFAIAEGKRRARVLGIDPSQEYVAYAMSRNPFPDRASFEVGDAQQLHFPDASFDAALSLLVFNFIPDPKKALLELRRVTKPGGKLSAAVWDYGSGMQMLRTFWDAAVHIDPGAEKLDEKRMPLCRAGELAALFQDKSNQRAAGEEIIWWGGRPREPRLFRLALPKPVRKQLDALLEFHLRIVAELRARLGNVRERDGHVAGLQRLTVNHRLFAERGFEQFNHPCQRNGFRFAEVKDFKAKFLLRAGDDAVQRVRDERVIARRAAVAENRNRLSRRHQLRKLVNREVGRLARAINGEEPQHRHIHFVDVMPRVAERLARKLARG